MVSIVAMRFGVGRFVVCGTALAFLALAACDDDSASGTNIGTSGGIDLPDSSSGSSGIDGASGPDAGGDANGPGPIVVAGPITCAATATDVAENTAPPVRVAKLDGARRLAAWIDSADSTPTASIYDGTKWLTPVKLTDKSLRIDVVSDGAGNGYIVYPSQSGAKSIRVVVKAGSTDFTTDEIAGRPGLDYWNHVVAPLATGAVMAINVPGTPAAVNVALYNPASSGWAPSQAVAPVINPNYAFAISSNGNRAALVTHNATVGGLGLALYDGATWSAPVTVPAAKGAYENALAGVYTNGDAYVVWAHHQEGAIAAGIYGQRFHAATKTFDALDEIAVGNGAGYSDHQVLIDARDHLTELGLEHRDDGGGSQHRRGVRQERPRGLVGHARHRSERKRLCRLVR